MQKLASALPFPEALGPFLLAVTHFATSLRRSSCASYTVILRILNSVRKLYAFSAGAVTEKGRANATLLQYCQESISSMIGPFRSEPVVARLGACRPERRASGRLRRGLNALAPTGGNGMKEENWHRRHAVMLASQLPEETEDALAVLRLATQLVTGLLAGPSLMKKRASVLVLKGGNECA
ncbi:hypothetical protein ACFIOY_36385 [Bradyrhizobium sp. TZ2]